MGFLMETGTWIWSAADADDCGRRLAQALVPSLGDWCVVDWAGPEEDPLPGSRRVAAARAVPPDGPPAVTAGSALPADLPAPRALAELLQRVQGTGLMQVYPGGTAAGGAAAARGTEAANGQGASKTDQVASALEAAGVSACLVVPLQAGGRPQGAVLLAAGRPGWRYGPTAIALVQALALATAAALEQRRLADRLAHIQRRLQHEQAVRTAIAETIGDGLLIVDADGRLEYANPAAQAKLGWRAAEMLGRGADAMFQVHRPDGTAQPVAPCPLLGVLKTGVPCPSHEEVFIRRGGRPLHVRVAAAPIKEDGQVTGAVIAFRNITSLKETQRRVEQLTAELAERVPLRTAELVEANRELEAFAYSVSHDLRAPLRTINGFSQALLEDYGDQLDATGRDYLARLKAASERMGELIDALLSLARVTRAELVREEVDLSHMAGGIARHLQRLDPQRHAEFHIQPGLKARGDRLLLRVVMENLLGNAWKFTRRRPLAVIEVGETVVDGQRTFYVRDNGVGFDMRYADKLFGPFQRLHPSQEFEGTGIGLATVQRIIRRHGGRIWGVGVVDGGATFYFTIEQGDAA
ncbi:MAG TPA: ATP-binding protein [Limnochordales bacterium]|nr:ATP-binding protein [Limnochordales bacterium]